MYGCESDHPWQAGSRNKTVHTQGEETPTLHVLYLCAPDAVLVCVEPPPGRGWHKGVQGQQPYLGSAPQGGRGSAGGAESCQGAQDEWQQQQQSCQVRVACPVWEACQDRGSAGLGKYLTMQTHRGNHYAWYWGSYIMANHPAAQNVHCCISPQIYAQPWRCIQQSKVQDVYHNWGEEPTTPPTTTHNMETTWQHMPERNLTQRKKKNPHYILFIYLLFTW